MNTSNIPVEKAIEEWLQYMADQNFSGDVHEVPESWALEIPEYLLADGYTIEQINSAEGYCFDL